MPRTLVFVPPRLSLAIHAPRFASFLGAYGVALPAAALAGPRVDLARLLWGVAASADFAGAVDLLDLFASELGGSAIADGAAAAKRKLPTHLPHADLAAVLLTKRANDATLEAVVERALHRFARVVPASPPLELVAREPRKARAIDLGLGALKKVLGGARFVDAWGREDERGALHVAVLRRDRARAPIVAHDVTVRRRARRDLAVDTIRIDVPDGRIVLGTDDPSLERAYADAIGASLFDDRSFFTNAPAYTLKSIVALGSKELAAQRPPGITRVRVVDLAWDDGEGTTHGAHGSDALAAYEAREGTTGGYVTSAMLRMDAVGVARSLDVLVRLPDRAEYRCAAHERLARGALAALGALAPGEIADDSYTMAPWVHAEWRWRRVLGDALFARLSATGALVRAKTRMVGGPEMGKYGWSYVSFDVKSDPGKKYAVAMDPALRSRDLEPDELRMWKLDLDAVKRALVADLATEHAPLDGAIEGRALDLGVARGRGLDLRVFAVLRSPGRHARALAEAMVRAAGTAHAVVLLPEGKTLLGGGVEIPLTMGELFGSGVIAAKVYARVAEKKGLAHDVIETWKLAGPGVRFVGEAKTGKIWLDGHALDDLRETGAKVLLGTARGAGHPVRTADLAAFIAPHRKDDGVIRQTVPKLGGWIRASFAAAGKTPPEDADTIVVWVKNKGWKMRVKCEVR